MKKIYLSLLCITMLFSACNESYEPATQEKPIDPGVLEFTYNGTFYSSPYDVTVDSTIIIYDENTNTVYQELLNNSELATFESSDGSIEYFDNFTAMRNAKNIPDPTLEDIKTRALTPEPIINFYFFEAVDYRGIYLTETDFTNKHLNLINNYDYWNDKIGSFKLRADFRNTEYKRCFVTIYSQINFTGGTRTFELSLIYTSYDKKNLREIHYQSGSNWRQWNDDIGSINYYFDPS